MNQRKCDDCAYHAKQPECPLCRLSSDYHPLWVPRDCLVVKGERPE